MLLTRDSPLGSFPTGQVPYGMWPMCYDKTR